MKKIALLLAVMPIFAFTSCVESNNVNKAINGDNDVDYESTELNYEENNYNR